MGHGNSLTLYNDGTFNQYYIIEFVYFEVRIFLSLIIDSFKVD